MIVQNTGKFRVKVDMSHFYEDERNLVYVLIDPKWDSVIRLEQHVQRLFDVEKVRFMLDDVHIPSGESIEIVKSQDVLRAIIPKRKKGPIKTSGCGDEVENNSKKRKHVQERPASSTPNERPIKKQRISLNVSNFRGLTVDPSEVQRVLDMNSPQSQERSDSENSPAGNSIVKGMQETFQNLENEVTVKTRKRKRGRKKKNSTERANSPRLSSVPLPISSSTVRLSRSIRTPGGQHTFFDETQTAEEQESTSKKDRVIYRCHLTMDDALEPRTIESEDIEEGAPLPKKPKIVIQKDLLLVAPTIDSSYEQNDISVIEIDESTMRPEQNGDSDKEPYPCISVDEILPLSEPLLDTPKVGEIILFKMYRLIEGSSPTISDYICCRCEQVDAVNGTMTCLVLDGLDQTDEIPRISVGDGDRIMPNKNTNYIMVFLDELLDKRVFRM